MKKVIIEQNGHVPMILSVPEGASVRIEDGVTLVEPKKYIPKDGDCVMCDLVGTGTFYFVYNGDRNSKGHYIVIFDNEAKVNAFLTSKFTHELIDTATQITPEEFQAEFNKLDYEYDFETHTAEKLKYTPKVGDCVKLIYPSGNSYFCEVSYVAGCHIGSKNVEVINDRVIFRDRTDYLTYDSVEKITPEELQAEFNKLGYEYDFKTHTAKKLVWKPKKNETYNAIHTTGEVVGFTWRNDETDLKHFNMKNVFHPDDTEGIEKYIAHIKSFER